MDTVLDPTGKTLMEELNREAEGLMKALQAAENAYTRFEVASQKFAAVRNLVARYLGHIPSLEDTQEYGVSGQDCYDFRFVSMAPGDAVVAVLKGEDKPRALDEILLRLVGGGFDLPDSMRRPQWGDWEQRARSTRRVVNAALMKTSGVERTEDGRYRHAEQKGKEASREQ